MQSREAMRLAPRLRRFIPRSVSTMPRLADENGLIRYHVVAEEDAPSGMLARGHYTAVSTFVDDDKHKHLEFEWSFDIAKDW